MGKEVGVRLAVWLSIVVTSVAVSLACRDFDSTRIASGADSMTGGTGLTGGGSHGGDEADAIAGQGGNAGAAHGTIKDGGRDGGFGGDIGIADLDHVVMWLEATSDNCVRGGDGLVSKIVDRSRLGNDAVERIPYAKPPYIEDVVNGHAALRFEPNASGGNPDDPTSLLVSDSSSLQFGKDDFAYILVMRWSNEVTTRQTYAGSGVILGKQLMPFPYPGILLMANYPAFFGGAPASSRLAVQLEVGGPFAVSYSDGLNDSKFRVHVVRRLGTDLALRINGVREGGTILSAHFDVSAIGAPLVIGGNPQAPLRGDIAELVALRGTTTDADLAGIEVKLMDKYALNAQSP